MNDLYLNYSDVVLLPDFSDCESRSSLNTKINFLGREFNSPVMPSNMKTTIDYYHAELLSENGFFYVLHRFYPYKDILNWIEHSQNIRTISISIGVKKDDEQLIRAIAAMGLRVDFITIDVAHGHHIMVAGMVSFIKVVLPNVKIIAGNIGTPAGVKYLVNAGASAIKVGLSLGLACQTYNATGVGTPMFTTVQKCAELGVPIIADGGIREVGDICKAMVAGASMVMVGGLFAQCMDSPAFVDKDNNKIYFGSASAANGTKSDFIEGTTKLIPASSKTYLEFYKQISDGITSCMSYAGVDQVKHLHCMQWARKQ